MGTMALKVEAMIGQFTMIAHGATTGATGDGSTVSESNLFTPTLLCAAVSGMQGMATASFSDGTHLDPAESDVRLRKVNVERLLQGLATLYQLHQTMDRGSGDQLSLIHI